MITGSHVIIYSTDADADRAFFRDVLKLPNVDVGDGWLIFAMPPAELGIHPSENNGKHEFYLMCDDLKDFISTMKAAGVSCSSPLSEPWGEMVDHRPVMLIRKIVAVSLLVSFVAMSTSGMMMFVIEKPSFTIQMHPVHKLFGVIMIISVIGHLSFNLRSLLTYVKTKSVALFGSLLVVVLVLLYGVAINNKLPDEIAIPMDELASKAEGH